MKLCLLGVSLHGDLLGLRRVRSAYSSREFSRNAAVELRVVQTATAYLKVGITSIFYGCSFATECVPL